MNYFSPSSGLPDQNVQGNPFWSGWNQGQAQSMMAPFRQNELEQQGLDLQAARAHFMESQSPTALANRQSQQQVQLGQNQQTIADQPIMSQISHQKHMNEFANMPMEQQQHVEQQRQAFEALRTKPERDQHEALANLAGEVHQASVPDQFGNQNQVQTYEQGIERIQRQFPNVPIPDRFKKYSPEGEKWLQDKLYGQVHSVAQQQKMETTIAGHQALQTEEVRAASNERIAAGRGDTAKAIAAQRVSSQKGPTSDAESVLMGRILDSPAKLRQYAQENELSEEDAKTTIKAHLQQYQENKTRDNSLKMAKEQAASSIFLPPNHPDKNKTLADYFDENQAKALGLQPGIKGGKDFAQPGEKVMVDKNGNKAVQRNGKWIEVH